MLDLAVKVTVNAVKSAVKLPSLKSMAVTSSMVAVMFGVKPLEFAVMMDRTWFSDLEICEQ